MSSRAEVWAKRGKVRVSRDRRGRFVRWQRIKRALPQRVRLEYPLARPRARGFFYPPVKKVAVYGTCRTAKGVDTRRYEFSGSGRYLQAAVILAHRLMPRIRFVNVSARRFLRHPSVYGRPGHWIDREVDSW